MVAGSACAFPSQKNPTCQTVEASSKGRVRSRAFLHQDHNPADDDHRGARPTRQRGDLVKQLAAGGDFIGGKAPLWVENADEPLREGSSIEPQHTCDQRDRPQVGMSFPL